MYPQMGPRRKRPEDIVAETGMPGELAGTAMPVGDETSMDPLTAMAPPSAGMGMAAGPEGIAAMLDPSAGAAPTNGPAFGQELSAGITNPGDAALEAGVMDPAEIEAEQMSGILDDPSADPDERNLIAQQLQLAARRRMAGL